MALRDNEELVTQSLLDRLTDHEPKIAGDSGMTRAQSVRLLKASLRRDLEWLFNSRANHQAPPADVMPEIARSVYNYGLPDFTHLSMANLRDRQRLTKQLELAITLFEPRLTGVQVQLVEQPFEAGKNLRFQIDGFLKMDPAPEHVSFDTVLDVTRGEYEVKGEPSAG